MRIMCRPTLVQRFISVGAIFLLFASSRSSAVNPPQADRQDYAKNHDHKPRFGTPSSTGTPAVAYRPPNQLERFVAGRAAREAGR